ncbi:MAG: hypothetical protein JWR44_1631, partial [Hymenobacter sp.]|nr:hypothetical protein [Hymenobacter sp.]
FCLLPEPESNRHTAPFNSGQQSVASETEGPLEAADRRTTAQQGLTLNQAQANATGQPSACAACTCPTGLVLEATVSPADLPAVLALGFTKK